MSCYKCYGGDFAVFSDKQMLFLCAVMTQSLKELSVWAASGRSSTVLDSAVADWLVPCVESMVAAQTEVPLCPVCRKHGGCTD